jgi:hypothetical protein
VLECCKHDIANWPESRLLTCSATTLARAKWGESASACRLRIWMAEGEGMTGEEAEGRDSSSAWMHMRCQLLASGRDTTCMEDKPVAPQI